jgi:large subunit ribosomal protein L25
MADVQLSVTPRDVLGKKVAALRRQGFTPANVYGRSLESKAVQVETAVLTHLLRSAGRNVIVDLRIEGEGSPRPVMLRGLQRDPVTSRLLHVDFYQVSLTEKMRTEVPLILVGDAPAVAELGGILLQSLDNIMVEALPSDIPVHVEVDVSGLSRFDDAVHVRELPIDLTRVHVMTDAEIVVAKVAAPRLAAAEEAEEAAAAEAAAEAAGAAPAAAEEEAAEAEGKEEEPTGSKEGQE